MKCKPLVVVILLAASGTALAEQSIPTVQVSSKPIFAVEVACATPVAPSRADVERLLKINDNTQTHGLSNKLMAAVGEACNAGVASIAVRRGAEGQSLTWAPARAGAANAVALN